MRELLCGQHAASTTCAAASRRCRPPCCPSGCSQLVRAGVVARHRRRPRGELRAHPGRARSCEPVVEAIGAWGMRWIGELGEQDLDPKLLFWDLHRNVDLDAGPGRSDGGRRSDSRRLPAKRASWWLVLTAEAVDVCDFDPGYEVGVAVTGGLRELVKVWRGDVGWSEALRSGAVTLQGPGPSAPGRPGLVPAVAVRRGAPRGGTLSVDGVGDLGSGHEGRRADRGQEPRVPGRHHPGRGERVRPPRARGAGRGRSRDSGPRSPTTSSRRPAPRSSPATTRSGPRRR